MRRTFLKNTILAVAALSLSTSVYAGEALDRVMSKGVLKVATDANWAPQSFLNDNNEMDGFDVNVAQEVAKRLGVDVEFITPDWAIITAGKWAGRWDVSVGSMTPTKDRAKVLGFPGVYYYTPASAAVHKDSNVQKASELSGKVVGAAAEATYQYYLEKTLEIDALDAPKFEFQITPKKLHILENSTSVLDDLRLGDGVRMDGMVGPTEVIANAIKEGYPVRLIEPPVFYEPLSLAIDKGDKAFNDKLAGIIAAMHEDGTLSKLSQKWYGTDYTKAY